MQWNCAVVGEKRGSDSVPLLGSAASVYVPNVDRYCGSVLSLTKG